MAGEAGGAQGQQFMGNAPCLGFASISVRKTTKEHKSQATICSPLKFEKKDGTNCISGVGKLKFGLEPQSKLRDALGWGFSVRETWASPVSSSSRLAQKQWYGHHHLLATYKEKKGRNTQNALLFFSFSTISHTDVFGGRREAIYPEASIDYFKHPLHQLLVILFQQLKAL